MNYPFILSRREMRRLKNEGLFTFREIDRYIEDRRIRRINEFNKDVQNYFKNVRDKLGIGDRWISCGDGTGCLVRKPRNINDVDANIGMLLSQLFVLFGMALGVQDVKPGDELNKLFLEIWHMATQGKIKEYVTAMRDSLDSWSAGMWPPESRDMFNLLLLYLPENTFFEI